jgi:pimeloyl-ACP methyl ester carboxylesterase
MQSRFIDLGGPVHYQEAGASGSPLLLVHGIGASYISWLTVIEQLAEHHRVLALDLIGFGFTPPHGRRATVRQNADLVVRFVQEMYSQPVTLIGNSMGGLVSMLAAAKQPAIADHLILVNPALPLMSLSSISRDTQRLVLPLVPFFGNTLASRYYHARTPEQEVDELLALVLSPGAAVDEHYRAAAIEMARARRQMEWTNDAFADAARSSAVELVSPRRFSRLMHQVTQPTLLIHGTGDRVIPPASARWAAKQRPDWDFHMIDGMGHTPQLENPTLFHALVEDWLQQVRAA